MTKRTTKQPDAAPPTEVEGEELPPEVVGAADENPELEALIAGEEAEPAAELASRVQALHVDIAENTIGPVAEIIEPIMPLLGGYLSQKRTDIAKALVRVGQKHGWDLEGFTGGIPPELMLAGLLIPGVPAALMDVRSIKEQLKGAADGEAGQIAAR